MEVIAKTETKLDLRVLALPFEYSFSWKKKRGVDKDWWFTPSGKGKIWFGSLGFETVGKITDAEYKALVKEMKECKCDALYNYTGHHSDVSKPYTFTNQGVVKCTNLNEMLTDMCEEFEARRSYEGWENL